MNESQRKKVAQGLKADYDLKMKQLHELRQEVSSIKMEIDTGLSQNFGTYASMVDCGCKFLDIAVCRIKRLHRITTKLQAIQLDDSREHRYVKYLQRRFSRSHEAEYDKEILNLVPVVTELSEVHVKLCREKEEMENDINTAYRALAKSHLHLTEEGDNIHDVISNDMTNFVKQHVNILKQKRPFQDRTNTPTPLHSTVDNSIKHVTNASLCNREASSNSREVKRKLNYTNAYSTSPKERRYTQQANTSDKENVLDKRSDNHSNQGGNFLQNSVSEPSSKIKLSHFSSPPRSSIEGCSQPFGEGSPKKQYPMPCFWSDWNSFPEQRKKDGRIYTQEDIATYDLGTDDYIVEQMSASLAVKEDLNLPYIDDEL